MSYQPIRTAPRRRRATAESLEGRLLMATTTFRNPLAINLFEDFNPPTPANLYPSVINVDTVTGPITELRVTLFGVYHDQPMDMDVLIVSPTGRSILVMSDAGGSAPISGETPVDLTFIDTATRSLPQSTQIASGVYRPTNHDQDDFFPDDDLFNAPTDTTLAGLTAGNPNGAWRLHLVDDTIGNVGGIGFGWGLTFVTGAPGPAAPSTPDLLSASDRGVSQSDNITNIDTPRFSGTATPGTQVRLFVNGIGDASTVTVGANGTYLVQAQAIPHGTHNISVRAIDAQGTEGPPSGDLLVTIDTVPPEWPAPPDLTAASDTGPSSTDNDTTDTTPTFTGTAPGASAVQLLANGLVVGTAPVVNNNYTVTPTNALATGTYEFTVLGSDVAGNVSPVSDPLAVVIRPGGTTTPVVTAVYARGSTWLGQDNNPATTNFMEYLENKGLGDDAYGFRVDNAPAGTVLPWININQLVVRFDAAGEPFAPGTLTLTGQNPAASAYTVTAVTPVPGDPLALVLSLSKPLGGGNPATGAAPTANENGDRIRLNVPGSAPGGGAYSLLMNVLQGDTDHLNEGSDHVVLARDYSEIKKKFFRDADDVPTGTDADYTPFHDVDGSGSILAGDYSEVKKRFFHALTVPAAAAAPVFGATRVADDVLA